MFVIKQRGFCERNKHCFAFLYKFATPKQKFSIIRGITGYGLEPDCIGIDFPKIVSLLCTWNGIYCPIVSVPGIAKCCFNFFNIFFRAMKDGDYRTHSSSTFGKVKRVLYINGAGKGFFMYSMLANTTLAIYIYFAMEVALKSHSTFPSINFMVHKEYFCLKCWAVPSLWKNHSLIIKSGWDFENSSKIMSRNFYTA